MVEPMRIDFPGLLEENTPAGTPRLRVRVAGNKSKRITLNVAKGHPAFSEHYHAARRGIQLAAPNAEPDGVKGSIGWLVSAFHTHMDKQVAANALSPSTRQYRTRHTNYLRSRYGEKSVNMPPEKLRELRDEMMDTPATANTFVKSIRALYDWAQDRGHASTDPTAGIRKLKTPEKGATPWTVADLKQYRERHPPGTMAHLYLTLLMFTACRIGDAVNMGRHNEFKSAGVLWLGWQPDKKGSPRVEIPMAPQLITATRAQKVIGDTYVLRHDGKPFGSENSLGNRVRKWCDQAGLQGKSSHGVRKAAGSLLADAGMSQHIIMSIHGHSEARTSEIYTKGAERRVLAQTGMDALSKIHW